MKITPPTSEDLTAQVAALKVQITELETDLTQTLTEEATMAKAKSDASLKEAAIAQGEKEVAAAMAKLATLKNG